MNLVVYKMKTERREYRQKSEENTRNLTANQIASFNFKTFKLFSRNAY